MAEKLGKCDNVTSLIRFSAFLIVEPQNKWSLWNPDTKLRKIDMFFKRKMDFKAWHFLPEPDLALGQMWKWPPNSRLQMAHKTCKKTLVLYLHTVTSFDMPWRRPELSISPLPIWHACHSFSSILAEFGLPAVSGLVSASFKGKRVSFDLTLTRRLTISPRPGGGLSHLCHGGGWFAMEGQNDHTP